MYIQLTSTCKIVVGYPHKHDLSYDDTWLLRGAVLYVKLCLRPVQSPTSCSRRGGNAVVYNDGRVLYGWQDTLYTYSCVVRLHLRIKILFKL